MILEIPKNAETILHILENAGYEAYVVGGCVRDSILGRNPDDWDITTSAKPDRKSTRLNSSHLSTSRMPSSA